MTQPAINDQVKGVILNLFIIIMMNSSIIMMNFLSS